MVFGVGSFQGRPPDPARYGTWKEYANALSAYVANSAKVTEGSQPEAIQLLHLDTSTARTVTDGLVVYDPVLARVMVCEGGAWHRLTDYAEAPAVYAQLTGNNSAWVSVTSGTSILTSANFDFAQSGGFTRGSTGDIVVPRAGHYRVTLKLYMGNSDGGRIEIHKNGSSQELLQFSTTSAGGITLEVSRIIQMAAGDNIKCVGASFEAPVQVYFGAAHSNASIQFIGV